MTNKMDSPAACAWKPARNETSEKIGRGWFIASRVFAWRIWSAGGRSFFGCNCRETATRPLRPGQTRQLVVFGPIGTLPA